MKRPQQIKHFTEIQDREAGRYPGTDEWRGVSASFGRAFGFKRLGIHHQVLEPGRRTSYPHAESTEEEFVYVIEGNPQVWIDGEVHELRPGDGIGFVPGTGVAHTFLNNTSRTVRLLVVGDTDREDNRIFYPLNPERKAYVRGRWWEDVPVRPRGPHDGVPDCLRGK